jgi:hypothetical protein
MIGQQDFDIEIVRKWFTNRSTIGELFGWDVFDNRVKQMCYTLEDEARPSGVKIPAFTCIPEGKYKVKITYSNRFKRDLPIIYTHEEYNGEQLVLVDGKHIWRGVRFHPGNTDADTEGCILPGTSKDKDRVDSSRIAFDEKLLPFIQNHPSLKSLGFIRLTIKNSQE